MLVLATLVLAAAAWLRGAEYDEQYTLFLTAGTARPDWPETAFPAGTVTALQAGHATLLTGRHAEAVVRGVMHVLQAPPAA